MSGRPPKLMYFVWFVYVWQRVNSELETNEIIADIFNVFRALTIPASSKMPCLTYDETLASVAASLVETCSNRSAFGSEFAYDVTVEPYLADSFSIGLKWTSEEYDYATDTCLNIGKDGCNNYKALLNEGANKVGCKQQKCSAATSACSKLIADCYLTVCKFDATPQKGPRSLFTEGTSLCTTTPNSCASVPYGKTTCRTDTSWFGLCCTPPSSPIAAVATTTMQDAYDTPFIPIIVPVDPTTSTYEINLIRGAMVADALHMTCLEWNPSYLTSLQTIALSCSKPVTPTMTTSVDSTGTGITDAIVNMIQPPYSKQYQTILNDKATKFACVQALCQKVDNIDGPTNPSTFTVCQFDIVGPASGSPYTLTNGPTCQCSSHPTKRECDTKTFTCCSKFLHPSPPARY